MEEQGVPVELELDGYDETTAIHFLCRIAGVPVAASRICTFGEKAKIQRVVVLKEFRGRSLGRELMLFMMDHIRANRLAPQIALDAQIQAAKFYSDLGFEPQGEQFDDAGIPHIHMVQSS